MRNQRATTSRKENKNILLISTSIFLALIILQFFFTNFFSSLFYTIAQPLWSTRTTIFHTSTDTVLSYESKDTLVSQITRQEAELYDLHIQNLELTGQLNSLTAFQDEIPPTETVQAKVLSKPPFNPYDSFVINVGTSQGLQVGNKVYVGKNLVIGKITFIEPLSSRVSLFSSGGNMTNVVLSRTGSGVVLEGEGDGNFTVNVPKDFDVTVGDIFTDSSARQSVVAQVYYIDTASAGSSFKKVLCRLPINIFQTEWIGVEKSL